MKSLNDCFYGSFVANRAAFAGPPAPANPDPIFFKACSSQQFGTFNAVLTEYPNQPGFSSSLIPVPCSNLARDDPAF